MANYPALFLFDLDKTLVSSGGGHKASFAEAFKKVYGVDTTIDIINYHGMTEQQIIRRVMKMKGISEKTIEAKLKQCMRQMVVTYNQLLKTSEKVVVLKGVRKLLKTLNEKGVLIGAVTGNLEGIAKGKLRKVGLLYYFKVGGFGSDHSERVELIRIAIKQAKKLGFTPKDNVYLFGDTPKDIVAGKKAEIITVGIASGIYSTQQLKHAGAVYVFSDLRDTGSVASLLVK